MVADQLAASAHDHTLANTSIAVPALDLKPLLKQKLRAYWQRSWDRQTHNKLHIIKPTLGNWPPVSSSRRTQVTLTRIRIGHTYSTHTYLLSGGDPPRCERCGEPLTVLHILIQCNGIDAIRKKHFLLPYRQQLPLHPSMFIGREPLFKYESLFAFLKDVNTFHVIFPGNP